MKLIIAALSKFLIGILLLCALLFIPVRSFNYPGAWLYLALQFLPMLIMGIVMLIRSPELLSKRLSSKEKEKAQKGVLALSGLMFPIGFVLSALDFAHNWSNVPFWAVCTASIVFISGYGMYAEVMRENAYLSRTIEVQDGQRVVDSGLYGVIRHPMYLATFLMFLPIPLILGSFWGLIPFALYPIIIVVRIFNEEKILTESLEGYSEYKTKVKYKLIPFIW